MPQKIYTTAQVLAKLAEHEGIKPHHGYIYQVVMRTPKRAGKAPHPLKAAHIVKGAWDAEIVDKYFEEKKNQ